METYLSSRTDLSKLRRDLLEVGARALTHQELGKLNTVNKINHLIDAEYLKIIDNENQLKQSQTVYTKKLIEFYIKKAEIEIEVHKLAINNIMEQ